MGDELFGHAADRLVALGEKTVLHFLEAHVLHDLGTQLAHDLFGRSCGGRSHFMQPEILYNRPDETPTLKS